MKFLDAGSSGEWGWHATELAMKCPQAFAYNYRVEGEGKRGKSENDVRPPLVKGSLVHQGLAHYYARLKDSLDGIATDWAPPEEAVDELASRNPGWKPFADIAKAAVRAYILRYANEGIKPISIEEVFEATISDPLKDYKFTQRLDLVAEDAAGRVIILDHKTTSMLNKDTASRYTLSGQFLGMANFGRDCFGKRFGGVYVNMIEISDRPGFMGFDFKRVPVDPAPNALRLFPITVRHARRRIDELDAAQVNPMEWPKVLSETVCTNAYGKCEWYEKCRWG